MANTKKLHVASALANKFIAGLLERREEIKTQVQFRKEVLKFQKRVYYQNEFDRLQGATRLRNSITARCKISNERTSPKSKTFTFTERWDPCFLFFK